MEVKRINNSFSIVDKKSLEVKASLEKTNLLTFTKDNVLISNKSNNTFNFINITKPRFLVGNIKGNPNGYNTEKDFVNAIKELNRNHIKKDFIVLEKNNKYFIYELKSNSLFDIDLKNYSDAKITKEKINIPENTNLVAISSSKNSIRFFNNDKNDKNIYTKIENPQKDESLESLENKLSSVLDRLDKMEKTLAQSKDHKGLFVSMYKVITNRALKEMRNYIKEGKIQEAEFEARLAINFANKYFDAYDNLVNGDIEKIPDAWRYAFDSGRKSQVENYPKDSIVEILALSMNAHIIHDLPLTLKEIGFDPKNKVMNDTFDHFNKALYEEKNNIIDAISKNYGNNLENFDKLTSSIDNIINGFSFEKHEPLTQNLFTSMRTIAKKSSQNMNEQEIKDFSSKTANSIISIIPGGNNEEISLRDNLLILFNENVRSIFKIK